MRKLIFGFLCSFVFFEISAQGVMTPEMLIQLKKVSGTGLSKDDSSVIYKVSQYNLQTNSSTTKIYKISINGGEPQEISDDTSLISSKSISPDGNYKITTSEVKLEKVSGQDFYPNIPNSNVQIYNSLNYRHWDTWEDGKFSHIFYSKVNDSVNEPIDIMKEEPFDSPQKPFGGVDDYVWRPDSKAILYVSKKLSGTAYAESTNSDIYEYNLTTNSTTNLTEYNKGYDTQPAFSSKGQLAWLQMKRDGYESDKNDIIIIQHGKPLNLTANWDGTVSSFKWQDSGDKIYFVAPTMGTLQLFEVTIPQSGKKMTSPKQLTDGQFDIGGIIGEIKNRLVLSRRDMNHATELYTLNLLTNSLAQLTHENDATYASIKLSKVVKRMIKATDGKEILTWVIYPPDFDPSKKYPTLLYCQGGPQAEVSQFYSFRWNFQLMAANGYIVVAPNRRGLPGFGVAWNEQISKDYGGQNMKDYLSAIDDVSKEIYVDSDRLGCIGASYGGYSVYYLAGHHQKRFKTFIAHDGIFDWKSMYGTTEELFFVNWDLGGAYWDKNNEAAQKAYSQFNASNFVANWTTPILIIQGGKDYRVPPGQGFAAFQAAQVQGIKSRILYFPEENHWVLDNQNSLVWQLEFYKWLKETL